MFVISARYGLMAPWINGTIEQKRKSKILEKVGGVGAI